jgi:hypothetical protein
VTQKSFVSLAQAFNESGVRYLVVGGLAVNAHGYHRLTLDIDIVLDTTEQNLRKAMAALTRLEYRALAPVPIEQFADASRRQEWISDFTLHNPNDLKTRLDLFVEAPFDFEKAYEHVAWKEIGDGVRASFVGFDDLIALKRTSGRLQDLADIDQLEEFRRVREDEARRGPDDPDLVQENLWPRGWAGHRRAQLRWMGKIPLPNHIAWLEEAQDLFKKR